jgi:hypothetical protein
VDDINPWGPAHLSEMLDVGDEILEVHTDTCACARTHTHTCKQINAKIHSLLHVCNHQYMHVHACSLCSPVRARFLSLSVATILQVDGEKATIDNIAMLMLGDGASDSVVHLTVKRAKGTGVEKVPLLFLSRPCPIAHTEEACSVSL